MLFAKVLFNQKIGNDSDFLTYSIPENLHLQPGQAVKAPLRNKIKEGVVVEINDTAPKFKTLPLQEAIYQKPLLNSEALSLLNWLSDYYFCSKHQLLKLFIPKRVLSNKEFRKSTQQKEQINRSRAKKLNIQQEQLFKDIIDSKKNKFLIHGVTGSGKTEIYARLADHHIKQGKQALILVPEISLTPQTIEYFEKTLGIPATVINSKLSEGQKYHAWMDIWNQKTQLIIGSRSAIFAPFQNLGIIIIDEEHELSYKQDSSPRYHTHRVTEEMQKLNPQIKIIFGSATPSIETAEKLKNSTLQLTERIGSSTLPDIEIVDLRDEFKKHNHSIFSEKLHTEITKTLEKKEQIILFLNRRGSASSVVCRDCGYTEICPECEIAKTYHSKTLGKPSLICHHCGKISAPPPLCPKCHGANIRFLGIGTQKIEAELLKEFPQAKVLRADKDTTSGKESFKKIYQDFKKHHADILVGTQMIAKGLHLPKVSLVGIILADIGLNIPDYRSTERNFQLMTQVSGRAGRSDIKGKVVIQTYNPENVSLILTQKNDYQGFFNYERNQRNLMKNPPFAKLAKIIIEAPLFSTCEKFAEKIENQLWKIAREHNFATELEINLYPAYIPRLRGKYRYIVLLKSPHDIIHKLLAKLPKEDIMSPNIKIDIDPVSIT